MRRVFASCLIFVFFLLSSIPAQAGFLPYGRIFKAAKDERAYTTQAHDTRLQLKLRRVLLMDSFSSLTDVSCYVYQGHGFLVGEVDSAVQRHELLETAQAVSGLNGVSFYLPVKKDVPDDGDSALEMKLEGMLEPNYPSAQVSLRVVQNAVVVLGVLTLEEQATALASVKKMCGGREIINFLQAPNPEDSKIIRPRPLQRLFE